MSYVAIEQKLVQLVDEISEVQIVYDHDEKELKQYPAATVTALGHDNEFRTTAANNRMFSFAIRVFSPTSDVNADSILRDITDKIITKLEANVTVAGIWDIAKPTRARFLYPDREIPTLMVEVTVEIQKYINR